MTVYSSSATTGVGTLSVGDPVVQTYRYRMEALNNAAHDALREGTDMVVVRRQHPTEPEWGVIPRDGIASGTLPAEWHVYLVVQLWPDWDQ